MPGFHRSCISGKKGKGAKLDAFEVLPASLPRTRLLEGMRANAGCAQTPAAVGAHATRRPAETPSGYAPRPSWRTPPRPPGCAAPACRPRPRASPCPPPTRCPKGPPCARSGRTTRSKPSNSAWKGSKPCSHHSGYTMRKLLAQRIGHGADAVLHGTFAKSQLIKVHRDVLPRRRRCDASAGRATLTPTPTHSARACISVEMPQSLWKGCLGRESSPGAASQRGEGPSPQAKPSPTSDAASSREAGASATTISFGHFTCTRPSSSGTRFAIARRTARPTSKLSVGSCVGGTSGRSRNDWYMPPMGLSHARPCLP